MPGVRIGVLIIGSLYWDNGCEDHRKRWRGERLRIADKQHVNVPIRYGRRSGSRGDSYTMVYSSCLSEEDFGQAIVVPCKEEVRNGTDLIKEAVELWTAETANGKNKKRRISASWGCVALLENPDNSVSDDVRKCWNKRVSDESDYGKNIICAYDEEVVINRCGDLKIPWPRPADGSGLNFSALLATATYPTLVNGQYPSFHDIAKANKVGKGRTYFCENREHGIKTFQDLKIKELWRQWDELSEQSSK